MTVGLDHEDSHGKTLTLNREMKEPGLRTNLLLSVLRDSYREVILIGCASEVAHSDVVLAGRNSEHLK